MTEFPFPTPARAPPNALVSSDSGVAALIAGYALRDAGDFAGAEQRFREAVALDPVSAEAWGVLAETLEAAGRPEAAVEPYRRAAFLEPDQLPWGMALAGALAAAGRDEASAAIWRQVLERRPDAARAHRGLARQLVRLGKPGEAVAHFREALVLDSADRETAAELAATLVGTGDARAAIEILQPALRRWPDEAGLHVQLGRAWGDLAEPDKARAAFRQAQALDLDDALGTAALIAATEASSAADPSRGYVRALFDEYAERFDGELTERLNYRAPEALRFAIERVAAPLSGGWDVLDLGCGTGLAGVQFRSRARHLAGVDLSPRMIDKARDRALYDALSVADLLEALDAAPAAWDLIVAADVLVYVGDLAPVMAAAARALRPGGRFAATVERLEEPGTFALTPSRRYAHGADYLRHGVTTAGLAVEVLEAVVPRWERRMPVAGLLLVAVKGAAD